MKKTVVCYLLVVFCTSAFGQTRKTTDTFGETGSLSQERASATIVQQQGVALEATIDPAKYFVGPSDVISVNIWTSPPLNATLTVTPEGTLIIPTVGEVKVSDMTLAKAKEKILVDVRKKYSVAQTTVTLLKPRQIIVSVVGNVQSPGVYTLSAIDRANKAIEMANEERESQNKKTTRFIEETSTRNIVLKHNDGSQERVDIVKFLATKDEKWNPYLREGDVVVVPKKSVTRNVFGIYGGVNAPGRYEFVEGDSLLDAIRIGQGFTRLAITDNVEFSRLNDEGTSMTTRVLDLRNILESHQPNFPLESGDRIVIKSKSELREDYRVTIQGEVLYPGTYPITKNQTKLSSIIKQAGGITQFAELKSAEVDRHSLLPSEIETERLLSLRGGVSFEDSADYRVQTELRINKELVSVDFEKLFTDKDSSFDIILQSEDTIIIPSAKKTVFVFGQAVSPGHVSFMNDKDVRYYIAKAGGFTERARRGDVQIIKSRTKQWLEPGKTTIDEGDYIWIPKEPDRPFTYYMTVTSQAASVISVMIGVAVVVIQLSK